MAISNQVFSIPELLYHIFSHLDSKEIQPIVTVSQQWSLSALDVLWSDVNGLWQVCHVLAPMRVISNSEYSFSRPLRQDDWDRLDRYASRIKILRHSWKAKHQLSPSVFDQLGRTRPRIDIFPNLRQLTWNFRLLDSLIFLHPRVRFFSVLIPQDPSTTVDNFSPYLASRLPDLEVLDMRANVAINGLEEPIISTVTKLLGLRDVSLSIPPSSRLLETLSLLPFLRRITLKPFILSIPVSIDVALQEDAFPSLREITLSFSYYASTKLVTQTQFSNYLTHFQIESPVTESPADLTELLNAIFERNRNLVSLRITSSMKDPPPRRELVDMRSLRPILQCSTLRSLEITHYHPLQLYPADLQEIALAFPRIENLILNCSPTDKSSGIPLPISSIVPFASSCPQLRRLGLFFDGSPKFIPSEKPETIFLNLQTLCVGDSSISNPRSLASFLSYLCPYVTTVITGNDWMKDFSTYLPRNTQPSKEWEEFSSLLPLLAEIRAEERVWMRRHLMQMTTRLPESVIVSANKDGH